MSSIPSDGTVETPVMFENRLKALHIFVVQIVVIVVIRIVISSIILWTVIVYILYNTAS